MKISFREIRDFLQQTSSSVESVWTSAGTSAVSTRTVGTVQSSIQSPIGHSEQFSIQSAQPVRFSGSETGYIETMANLQELQDHTLCWVKKQSYMTEALHQEMKSYKDLLVVTPFEIEGVNCIINDYPKGCFFNILNHFFKREFSHSISETATVLTNKIGKNVHIGPRCFIAEDVSIGDNTVLHANVVIDCPCKIGYNCEIHSGAVIGTDVEGFYYDEDGVPIKETHYRGIIIGDNVEIGANTTIACGLLTDTKIGNNVKIWDLCHIGHNAQIGENCLIIVGSYVCGSAKLNKGVYLAPASVVLNQVTCGEDATIGVNSVAMCNVKEKAKIMGTPGLEVLPRVFK